MIFTVTLNPCVDHVLFLDGLRVHDTNRVIRAEVDAGGKGVNLARVACELGAVSIASGFLGGGPGGFVRRVLELQGVRHDFVEIHGVTRENVSIEAGDGPPTTLNQRGPEISGVEYEELLRRVAEHAAGSDWVAFGGSLPPGLQTNTYRILVELSKQCGARVLLDADGEAMIEGLRAGPDFIKPNAAEAERLVGRPVRTTEDALAAAHELADRLRSHGAKDPIVVISRGKDGAVLHAQEGDWVGHPIPVETRSTIGSGDSLLGGMLVYLVKLHGLEESFRVGLAAGAATATTDGSEIARKAVVERLLAQARVERVA